MDECEALCNRLTIMVDGVMKCIGNIQYLKNRYGQGFTVMIKLRNNETFNVDELKRDIERQFDPEIKLKDEHKVSYSKCTLNKMSFLRANLLLLINLMEQKGLIDNYNEKQATPRRRLFRTILLIFLTFSSIFDKQGQLGCLLSSTSSRSSLNLLSHSKT